MHGSHTSLGSTYDTNMIAVISYAAYRNVIDKVAPNATGTVKCLGSGDSCLDGPEVAKQYAFFSREQPRD